MAWEYHQKTGTLLHDGAFEGTGYSGRLGGLNNPDAQSVPMVGPIPQGEYDIGQAHASDHLGPCVMALTPREGTDTHGRSGFYVHGDSARHDASHGCVVLGPAIRHLIAASPDRLLIVTA
jgi:hypothetical protein